MCLHRVLPQLFKVDAFKWFSARKFQNTLKLSHGTERMDQPTLDALCEQLPKIDFRQTYGMTELGVVRVKSKARNSLFMKIGGGC